MRARELQGIDDARKDPKNAPPVADKMRESFEERYPLPEDIKWCDFRKRYRSRSNVYPKRYHVAKEYCLLLEGWQASRACIEVELPECAPTCETSCCAHSFNDAINAIKHAIESQGLRVKQ